MRKKAFITGISGQDGSYLAEFLLEKGYEVHGLIRRHSVAENQTARIEHIRDKITLHYGDLTDLSSLFMILNKSFYDEVYNLGAMSNVGVSFKEPIYTQDANYIGFINLMEAIMQTQNKEEIKVYQASSSEMFGNSVDSDLMQRETTEMIPVSPYGISKLASHRYAQHLRRAHGLQIWCGILFNHESPRRGTNFVTGKVAKGVAEIKLGLKDKLELGVLDTFRDWGHSKDYVKIMWQMLNETEPDDFICCTEITHNVKQLCEIAFGSMNLNWEDFVVINDIYKRDEELYYLRGCSDKLTSKIDLKFEYDFKRMIIEMVDYHYINLKK
jgi:GDPmannose 4,6-dehydratase